MGSETAKEYPRYISEFIGTYVLVLTVGCNVLGGSGAFAALSIAPDAKVIGMFVAFTRAMYEPGRGGSEINLHSAARSFIEIPHV